VGLCAGVVLLATSNSALQFVLGVIIYGLGLGLYVPGAIIHLSALFTERRGQVLGLNSGATQLGGIVASLLSGAILTLSDWKFAFIPVFVVLLLLAIIIHWSRREGFEVGTVSLSLRPTLTRLLGHQQRRRVVYAAATFAIAMEGILAFLPTVLQVTKGFPSSLASNTFAGYFVVGLLINPIAGKLADRYRPNLAAAVFVAVAVLGIIALVLADHRPVVLSGVVLFAVGVGGFWPPFNTHLMEVLSSDGRGSEYGAARTVWVGIGSIGPGIVGVVGSWVNYNIGFAILGGVLIYSIWMLLHTGSG